ncbi:MAG: parallel beta-helix repeat protein, partial [Verrucomicrobiales bacterium]
MIGNARPAKRISSKTQISPMLSLGSNTKILALASLSLTLLSAAIASARTVVSGSITEDVTWNAAGSPYEVSDTTVVANATITILSGTLVQFLDFSSLHVHGRIVANGSALEKITFTSLSGATEGSPWRVIRLTNDDGSGNGLPASSFTHCVFEGGGNFYHTMLEVSGEAQLSMEECVFRHSVEDGVRFYQDSGGAISNTRFENNAGYGLWLRGSSPAVSDCTFSGNGNIGRLESGGGKGSFPAFTNTTFQNSGHVHIASNIESSGTLTAAPYYLDGHRVALAGASLTIDAGASFRMEDFATWTVHGNVIANGTAA